MKQFRFYPEIKLDQATLIPLRSQIVEQIRRDIVRNRLAPGIRLVSERQLSDDLMVNRNTVHQAYEELISSELLEVSPLRGGGVMVGRQAPKQYRVPFPTVNLILPYTFSEQLRLANRQGLDIIGGLLDRAAALHISVNILALPPMDMAAEKIGEWLEEFIPRSIGIITFGLRSSEHDPVFEALLGCRTVPHVFISAQSNLDHISSVIADVRRGAEEMLETLAAYGHRALMIVSGTPPRRGKQFVNLAHRRGEEIAHIAREHGFDVRQSSIEYDHQLRVDAEKFTAQLLAEPAVPRALWVQNDVIAEQLIQSLQSRGVRIPEDFSIIGYDNNAHEQWQLSSIDHSRTELGAAAVDVIAELFEHGSPGDACVRTVPSRFICRASVGAATRTEINNKKKLG